MTSKIALAIVFLLPNMVSASMEISNLPADIEMFDQFYLGDPPRGSKLTSSASTVGLAKNVVMGSGIRPISEIYSVNWGYSSVVTISDGGSIILDSGNAPELSSFVPSQSQPILSGSISLSSSGTLALTNQNYVLFPFTIIVNESDPLLLEALIAVPEPSNLSMLAMGLFAISLVARRKAKQH